jgi:hypothetical protein
VRGRSIAAGVALIVLAVGVVIALGLFAPRSRPRPEGWKKEWEALPLEKEGEWAVIHAKRGAVQGLFMEATERLSHCVRKYEPKPGEALVLELMTETVAEGTHFEWVEADPKDAFSTCLGNALEGGALFPTPNVPPGTRWRLQFHFLVPAVEDLPQVPWWRRLLPDGWRPRPEAGTHVG